MNDKNLNEYYLQLFRQENEFIKRENEFLKRENERLLNLYKEQNDNENICYDYFHCEWAVFKRNNGLEIRLGDHTSVGTLYPCFSFLNVFNKWLETDIGKNYSEHIKLKGIYISKLDLSWTANDWRAVDDENSKLSICVHSNRFRIKYLVELVNNF